MKKLLSLLIFTVGFSSLVLAQDTRMHTVKVNLHAPWFNSFYMAYEHVLSDDITAGTDFFILGNKYDDVKWSGFGISPEIRFYFKSNVYSGYYIAPYVRYQYAKITDAITKTTSTGSTVIEERIEREGRHQLFGFGMNFGHNFVFNDRVCIDVYAGPQFQRKHISGEARPRSAYFNAVYFARVGVNIGFRF
ncbi:MAG: DUF3575 domain-containing protein [Flexibacteraceae bacterium]